MYLVVIFLSSEVAPVHPELGISAASLWDKDTEGEEGGSFVSCFIINECGCFIGHPLLYRYMISQISS